MHLTKLFVCCANNHKKTQDEKRITYRARWNIGY